MFYHHFLGYEIFKEEYQTQLGEKFKNFDIYKLQIAPQMEDKKKSKKKDVKPKSQEHKLKIKLKTINQYDNKKKKIKRNKFLFILEKKNATKHMIGPIILLHRLII